MVAYQQTFARKFATAVPQKWKRILVTSRSAPLVLRALSNNVGLMK